MPVTDAAKSPRRSRKQLEEYGVRARLSNRASVAFEFAGRLAKMPSGLDRIFFTNSGSESVDTALKIAIAYHRAHGTAQRTRLVGREKGYHGVGFGGLSVGGIVNNRHLRSSMLPGVDHLPHTLDIEHNAFSRGLPQWGAILRTSWSGCSPCMTPRPLPRSSSNRSPDRRA